MKIRILAVLVVLAAASTGFAQANNGGRQNGRGNRGNGQPGQGRQQFDQRLKDQLGVSDDEWNALQPRIDKVRQLQRDASTRGPRNANGRNGRGNRNRNQDQNANSNSNSNPDRPTSEVQQKAQALQQLLDSKDASQDAIKAAVTDFRQARAKARGDLKKAQDDLRDLLTARQESVLVMAGLLE